MELKNNTCFQIVGPSGSGKTHFVCKLLQNEKLVTRINLIRFIGIMVVLVKVVLQVQNCVK